MRKVAGCRFATVALVLLAVSVPVSPAQAKTSYGPKVDAFCVGYNGATPYMDYGCNLCHAGSNYASPVQPAWNNYLGGNYVAFCPELPPPPPNQAPNGTISLPASDLTITKGQSVDFRGSGTDPDNHLPLAFGWRFGGAASDSAAQDPSDVTFNSAGTYTVTLTVTDALGLADPSPARRIVTVEEPRVCTDADRDGYSPDGGDCGPIDCDDQNPAVNPGAVEACTDGADNDCDGLLDEADATAVGCPVACMDNDGDQFSPDGGICGPLDCDDFDAAVNPGATELCSDGADNDCDGWVDADDGECIPGADCFAGLGSREALAITTALWRIELTRLLVRGEHAAAGAVVAISNADTGARLGEAAAGADGSWVFRLLSPAAVPCQVQAAVSGQSATSPVTDAPADCDDGDRPAFAFRAQWRADLNRLRVVGRNATSGARVVLRNANTSERLGVTEVTSLGTWTFVLRRPASVPCRVLALEVGGPRGKRSVLGAPADCDRVARAPEASNDAYSVVAGETLQAAAPGVLGNDGDADGDPLSASLVAGVQHGTLSLQPNGAFTYTPATGFSGIDGFTYAASDGSLSATANVELVVTAPPPNAVDMVLTEARWSSGDHKLTAKGRNGPSRRTIDIVAADSGVLLARVDAEGDGQFEVEQRLSQGPCAIQARHRGNFSQPKAVLGAPARCYDDDDDDDD